MHRAVDYFSDNNPVYLRSVHRLQQSYGKYSGIIMDMFYDYLLANNWSMFASVDLKEFCKDAYAILSSHKHVMPEESRTILTYMMKNDWLYSYRKTEGIREALKGMSQRMKYYFPMDKALNELEKDKHLYNSDFVEFFPLLIRHTELYRTL